MFYVLLMRTVATIENGRRELTAGRPRAAAELFENAMSMARQARDKAGDVAETNAGRAAGDLARANLERARRTPRLRSNRGVTSPLLEVAS